MRDNLPRLRLFVLVALVVIVLSGCINTKRSAEVVVSKVYIEHPTWASYDIIVTEIVNVGNATGNVIQFKIEYLDDTQQRIAESNHDSDVDLITPGSRHEVWSTWVQAKYVKVTIWYDASDYTFKEYSATLPVPYSR